MSVNVTINNQTMDYAFYVGPLHDKKIAPNSELALTLEDYETQVLTFDRYKDPTLWQTYGLGDGMLAYSLDQAGDQSNFCIIMRPAAAGPQETPPPIFDVTGEVTGSGHDDWDRVTNLILHGDIGGSITVTITEEKQG